MTIAHLHLSPFTIPSRLPGEVVVHESIRGLLRPAAAEFLGSALFVFICCGTGVTTVKYQIVGNVTIGIALTFGLTIFVLCYTIGHISGGHLNFAVTFTFALLRKISLLKAGLYFLAQWLGGMVGIGFLVLITPDSWQKSCYANNVIHPELTVGHAFVVEFVLTFFLMFVIMAACDTNKSNQTLVPLAIGLAVFCAHMIALPIDGCSINPTRTFASAVAASGVSTCNAWANHWVFWLGPIMGASMAGILYEYVFWEGQHAPHTPPHTVSQSPSPCMAAAHVRSARYYGCAVQQEATKSTPSSTWSALAHARRNTAVCRYHCSLSPTIFPLLAPAVQYITKKKE